MASLRFAINPELNVSSLAERYRIDGRLQIADFLEGDTADRLHTLLRQRSDWLKVINSGAKLIELSRKTSRLLSPDQVQSLDDAVYSNARNGFQYRYETIRVPDDVELRKVNDDPLTSFALWMSSDEVSSFFRRITDAPIHFADAQATAYSPGDFLTGHDDEIADKHRHAAYVLGLNPIWRLEWGGLLLFHEHHQALAIPPRFNCLNLFRVGQMHSVSEVTRAAAYRRYSITGWLRTRGG